MKPTLPRLLAPPWWAVHWGRGTHSCLALSSLKNMGNNSAYLTDCYRIKWINMYKKQNSTLHWRKMYIKILDIIVLKYLKYIYTIFHFLTLHLLLHLCSCIYFHFMNNLLLTHNIHHSIFYNSTFHFIIRVLLDLNVVKVLHIATLHLWLFPQERLLPWKLLDQRDELNWQLSNQKVHLHSHTTAGMEETLPCQPHSCDCFFKKAI